MDKPGGPARITLYHTSSGNPIRQVAYLPDGSTRPVPNGEADNSIPEILMLDQFRMLVLERNIRRVGNSRASIDRYPRRQ